MTVPPTPVDPQDLPPLLPDPTIARMNRPDQDLHTTRHYRWNALDLDVPPGVFRPGLTSAMIFDRVASGEIETRGRRYLAMGCGLGVETVAAALRGAAHVYAVDIHRASVEAAQANYARFVGGSGCTGIVSDLLDAVPDGAAVDVLSFNPPAVSRRVSDDPDVIRNVCVGAGLIEQLFAQLDARQVLVPDGLVYLIASNTADLPAIVHAGTRHGFAAYLVTRHDWGTGVITHLFCFARAADGAHSTAAARQRNR